MILGIDLHGVIDKYPIAMRNLMEAAISFGHKVVVVSGPPKKQIIMELNKLKVFSRVHYSSVESVVDFLKRNDVCMWQDENGNWWCDDEHWWDSKAGICKEINAYCLIDDSPKYGPAFNLIDTKFILMKDIVEKGGHDIIKKFTTHAPDSPEMIKAFSTPVNPEARSPMNATCEKCGRVYCDHEEKY